MFKLFIRLGDGRGGFRDAPGSPISVPQSPEGIAVGDFNGDHHPDILVASGKAELLLGDGRGGFHQAPGPLLTVPSGAVVAGDFNGDGHLDFVDTSQTAQGQLLIQTFFGDGHGHFSAGPTSVGSVPGNPGGWWTTKPLVTGDFNGDGHLDLAYAYGPDYTSNYMPPGPPGALDVLLGNGKGAFREAPGSPYPGGTNFEIGTGAFNPVVGDFNGDGYSDLAQDERPLNGGSGEVRVLLGGPSGRLTSAPGSPFALPYPGSLATGDVNRDGHLDLVSAYSDPDANEQQQGYAVLRGDGTGGFRDAPGSPWRLRLTQDEGSALADFNRDGRPDLVVTDAGGGARPPSGLHVLLAGPPVADLTVSPTRIEVGVPVRLSAVERSEFMGAAIRDYRWDLGSGHFTIDSRRAHSIRATFHRTGILKVRLKVTDSAGHTATDTKRLDVLPRRTRRHRP